MLRPRKRGINDGTEKVLLVDTVEADANGIDRTAADTPSATARLLPM
jgi:hypothetical protein